jgi:hypothetical protein
VKGYRLRVMVIPGSPMTAHRRRTRVRSPQGLVIEGDGMARFAVAAVGVAVNVAATWVMARAKP